LDLCKFKKGVLNMIKLISKKYTKYMNKAKLKNLFMVADLKLTFNNKNATVERYPAIGGVNDNETHTDYTFYLPQGFNPKKLIEKEYVFTQTFGDYYDLKGDGKMYRLRLYKNVDTSPKVYDQTEIETAIKGHGLPIVAGYNLFGNLICYDMVPNPHLLIAGESGSGKSMMLRTILSTLLLYKRDEIDFYLADMKRTEFHIFRNRESVRAVITDKKRLALYLAHVHAQLEIRGKMLDARGLDHIDHYNKIPGVAKQKYIVFAIDEVALLRKDKEIMSMVEDISTQGRAMGIFLILSMQRPDSKILDGQLKSNLTVRYAFRHADVINSNITLGSGTGVDASSINKADKGKFYMRHEEIKLLQAPKLEIEDAKELLDPLSVPPVYDPIEELLDTMVTDFNSDQTEDESEEEESGEEEW